MQKIPGLAVGLSVLALLPLQNARAQDVKAVVAKTDAVYQNMKTLQATFDMNVAMGAQRGLIQTNVKILAGQKASVITHAQGTNGAGGASKSSSQSVVDDGVNLYLYVPQLNQYMKHPHNPNALLQQVAGMYGLPYLSSKNATLKLLPSVKMDGKPAYVVEVTPNQGPTKGSILITIDQATYHVKQNKMIVTSGANKGSVTTTIKNEIINAPLPPAAFVFTPPKGAKEIVPPPPGAGGMPGGPGGAPPAPRPGGMNGAPPPRPGGKP